MIPWYWNCLPWVTDRHDMLWGDYTYSTKLQFVSDRTVIFSSDLFPVWATLAWDRGVAKVRLMRLWPVVGWHDVFYYGISCQLCTAVMGAVHRNHASVIVFAVESDPEEGEGGEEPSSSSKYSQRVHGAVFLSLIAERSGEFPVNVQTSLHLHDVQLAQSCTRPNKMTTVVRIALDSWCW